MAWLFLAMATGAVIWQAVVPVEWQFSRAFLPNKAQYFALGVSSAAAVRGEWRGFGRVLVAALVLCGVGGGVEKLLPPIVWTICLAAQVAGVGGRGLYQPTRAPSPYPPPARGRGTLLLRFACILDVLVCLLCSRVLVWLGAVSYCIYLVNEPVQKLLGIGLAVLARGDATLFSALWLPSATLLPILVSWWLHEWIELPAQRYGRGLALATKVQ